MMSSVWVVACLQIARARKCMWFRVRAAFCVYWVRGEPIQQQLEAPQMLAEHHLAQIHLFLWRAALYSCSEDSEVP